MTLTYDPMGRLWQVSGPSSSTRFLYDGDELVADYDNAGALLRRYVHGNAIDDPVVWYEGSSVGSSNRRQLFADRQGSVVAVADANGAIIARNSYDEYGIPKSDQPGQAVYGRFAYTGQIWLPEIGMYHYKARLYSPTLGRFLQVDPVGYDDQINLYAYVFNDPINMMDSDGLAACNLTAGGCGAEIGFGDIIGDKTNPSNERANPLSAIEKVAIKEGQNAIQQAGERSHKENREAGGLIYAKDGAVDRTPTEWGDVCPASGKCSVPIANQLTNVPDGAKILFTWHTHGRAPQNQNWLFNKFSPVGDHEMLRWWQTNHGVRGALLGNPQGQIRLLLTPYGPQPIIGRYDRPWLSSKRKR